MEDIAVAIFAVLLFSIPIVVIIGNIIKQILRTVARYRLMQLAYRERIALMERGIAITGRGLSTPESGASWRQVARAVDAPSQSPSTAAHPACVG